MYLGIDLGTSNSAIAGIIDSVPRVFKTTDGADYLPSVIYIDKRGNRLYGQRAHAQTFMSPDNTASGFKRVMGTDTDFEFSASATSMTAEECSAEVLRQLTGQALTESGTSEIYGSVVTIPAAFNQMQSESTLAAARMAGLEKVALLQEPIAAAMAAMSHSKSKNGQFLVYDLGGGTFDLALVQSVSGTINILAHEGVNMLGGRDIDKAILNSIVRPWLMQEFDLPQDYQCVPKYKRIIRMAAYAAEKAKIGLSTAKSEVISASEEEVRVQDESGEDIYLQIPLDRSDIQALVGESVNRTLELSRKIMKDHGYSHDDIDRIVFIGGPTKMPIIRERVPIELGIPADLETNPMTAVALGAAIYCESRNWSEGGTSRKTTRGTITTKGKFSLRLDYPSRTNKESARMMIRLDKISETREVELELSSHTGWTSGRAHFKDGMTMDMPLHDFGDNVFQLKAFDSSGRPIDTVSETITVTRVQASAAGIPATQTISVKVMEGVGTTRNVLEPLVVKGTLLPASGTKSFRAARALKNGAHDYLEFALFQDEGVPEVDLNLCVGSFRISGEDLTDGMRIQIGDTINVKWFMSDSGLLQATLELPTVGQTFPTPKFYSPQAGHQSFSLEEGTRLATEMLDQAMSEIDSAEEAIGAGLTDKAEQLRAKLSEQLENLKSASDGEDTRAITETVRYIRQEISCVRHDPNHLAQVHTQELTGLQAAFNQLIRDNVDEHVAELFDQHSSNAQKALAKGDERSMREVEAHLEAMQSIQMRQLFQDPRFLIRVFQDRTERGFLASDRQEFDRLVQSGQDAIEQEDIDALRTVIFRLDEILISTGGIENDVTKLSSIMRG